MTFTSNDYDRAILPFTDDNCTLIESKDKWKTYRLGRKYDHITSGDDVYVVNSDTGDVVTEVQIKERREVEFSQLPLDEEGHESYESKDHQRKVFNDYYSYIGRDIRYDDTFLVFTFE